MSKELTKLRNHGLILIGLGLVIQQLERHSSKPKNVFGMDRDTQRKIGVGAVIFGAAVVLPISIYLIKKQK